MANEHGYLTNAGALLADESPIHCSRLFCTRWNGLNKSGGTVDAFDDAEYEGSIISLIENGEAFIKRNCKIYSSDKRPSFRSDRYQFTVVMPNLNYDDTQDGTKDGTNGTEVGTNSTGFKSKFDTNEKAIIQVIRNNPKITQKDICVKTGIPLRTVKRTMSELQKNGKLRREGTNRNGLWLVIDQKE